MAATFLSKLQHLSKAKSSCESQYCFEMTPAIDSHVFKDTRRSLHVASFREINLPRN
jgi:hypothetical protein